MDIFETEGSRQKIQQTPDLRRQKFFFEQKKHENFFSALDLNIPFL